jgi:hypothetical protein
MPAKAGVHACRDAARYSWTPAFAGVTEVFESLPRNGRPRESRAQKPPQRRSSASAIACASCSRLQGFCSSRQAWRPASHRATGWLE